MRLDMLDQTVGILAHFEEIGFLGGRRDIAAALGTFPLHELGLRVEGLALLTVHALILSLIDIALIVHDAEDLLDLSLVIFVRRADELIVGRVHQIPDPPDLTGCRVDILLRRPAGLGSAILDLLSVLVRPCLEKDVIAFLPLEAGDRIRENDFICVADMRFA